MKIRYVVTSSRRYENDVITYGLFSDLDSAQSFMVELANRVDDTSIKNTDQLEDNYYIDTDMFNFSISLLNNPEQGINS